jgi:hypothetical protein
MVKKVMLEYTLECSGCKTKSTFRVAHGAPDVPIRFTCYKCNGNNTQSVVYERA